MEFRREKLAVGFMAAGNFSAGQLCRVNIFRVRRPYRHAGPPPSSNFAQPPKFLPKRFSDDLEQTIFFFGKFFFYFEIFFNLLFFYFYYLEVSRVSM